MSEKIVNRILLINDDGIDAPGIAILKEIAKELANEVWVVAPISNQSGVSCSISVNAPFRAIKRSEKEYAVYGTPADCSLFAIKHLMINQLPDLVLSGINEGSNAGFETIISGTVGAAIMSMALKIPSIALSQFTSEDEKPTNWNTSKHYAMPIIKNLLSSNLPEGTCFNINFPACDIDEVKGVKITKQGDLDVTNFVFIPVTDPEGQDYYWLRAKRNKIVNDDEEKELDATNNNYIAITPLGYERTDYPFYEKLKKAFNFK